ncbi:uncharacterized protein A1O9_05241 [Exophiala aquamarina CBS 119918]|uniref:Defect at low temperature protein 1 n=1 Tax=Exophiala aquamarina CBS 119918 TaxID=1182545 RepID=A0A072PB66_9EURO|nr:uncharacterized protein A1O9_05241 [Exophiala aquamarina CBS 119918]KEF57324.1 hypothetical protein A1O9_05241 [Exophiala aquamarina CBS 119918]
MARAPQIVFRIFYSTSFTIVFLLLICFICVTPADAIYESYRRRRTLDIFLMSGDYVVTALIAVLIYASRLYTNRSILKEIPKSFMPIEKEELPERRVHKLIQDCLAKSAVIAYQARPRSTRIEHDTQVASARVLAICQSRECTDPHLKERWGHIDHPGWSSPTARDTPNLEYATVVDELTDLIEAKAISLAPVDPLTEPGPDGLPLPDPRIIDELSRGETVGMRAYLQHLIEIGVLPDNSLTVAFLSSYERARFSPEPISEQDFQALMRMFAEILRSMRPVDLDLLDLEASSYYFESEKSSIIHHGNHQQHYQQHREGDKASIPSTFSDSGSVRRNRPPPHRISEDSVPSMSSFERDNGHPHPDGDQSHGSSPPRSASLNSDDDGNVSDDEADGSQEGDEDHLSLRTAPTHTQRSLSRPNLHGHASSSRFVSAHSRQGLGLSLQPTRSHSSMRSTHSVTSRRSRSSSKWSTAANSVIRLARPEDEPDARGLPYLLQLPRHDDD